MTRCNDYLSRRLLALRVLISLSPAHVGKPSAAPRELSVAWISADLTFYMFYWCMSTGGVFSIFVMIVMRSPHSRHIPGVGCMVTIITSSCLPGGETLVRSDP